jgi:Tfp pilus assembly protein PilZ
MSTGGPMILPVFPYPLKEFFMENNEDYPEKNDVIIQLIKRVLEMTDGERLDLLGQLNMLPVQDLSLGDRDGTRRDFDQTISFSTQERQYTALCKDISNGGIFVQTGDVFRLGQMVTLEIPFSHGKESIKVPAEIVRVNPDGIGLKFMKKDNVTYV